MQTRTLLMTGFAVALLMGAFTPTAGASYMCDGGILREIEQYCGPIDDVWWTADYLVEEAFRQAGYVIDCLTGDICP